MTTIDTSDGMKFLRLASLRGRLALEIKGLTFKRLRGRMTTYSYLKKEVGYKGRREAVLTQLEQHIKEMQGVLQVPPGQEEVCRKLNMSPEEFKRVRDMAEEHLEAGLYEEEFTETKEEALDKIRYGQGHALKLRRAPFVTLFEPAVIRHYVVTYNDVELGERVRQITLAGFPEDDDTRPDS